MEYISCFNYAFLMFVFYSFGQQLNMNFKVDAFNAVFKNMNAEIATATNLSSDMLRVILKHMRENS